MTYLVKSRIVAEASGTDLIELISKGMKQKNSKGTIAHGTIVYADQIKRHVCLFWINRLRASGNEKKRNCLSFKLMPIRFLPITMHGECLENGHVDKSTQTVWTAFPH